VDRANNGCLGCAWLLFFCFFWRGGSLSIYDSNSRAPDRGQGFETQRRRDFMLAVTSDSLLSVGSVIPKKVHEKTVLGEDG